MSFNINDLPLVPQSKEISNSYNRDYNQRVWTDRHVQSRSDDLGTTMLILRALNMGRPG